MYYVIRAGTQNSLKSSDTIRHAVQAMRGGRERLFLSWSLVTHAFGWNRFRIMRMVRTTLSPQVPGDGTDFCNISPLFWKYLQATRTWTR